MFLPDIETQETNESNKTSVHDAQNVLSPAMVDDTGIVIILLFSYFITYSYVTLVYYFIFSSH